MLLKGRVIMVLDTTIDDTLQLLTADSMKSLAVKKFSKEHKVLLVCDISLCANEPQRQSYINAINDAGLFNDDQYDRAMSGEILLIVIPFYTIKVATDLYRKIDHASHFVSVWEDGIAYSVEC